MCRRADNIPKKDLAEQLSYSAATHITPPERTVTRLLAINISLLPSEEVS